MTNQWPIVKLWKKNFESSENWSSWNSNQSKMQILRNCEHSTTCLFVKIPGQKKVVSTSCPLSEDYKLEITIFEWFAWIELKNYSISFRSTLAREGDLLSLCRNWGSGTRHANHDSRLQFGWRPSGRGCLWWILLANLAKLSGSWRL